MKVKIKKELISIRAILIAIALPVIGAFQSIKSKFDGTEKFIPLSMDIVLAMLSIALIYKMYVFKKTYRSSKSVRTISKETINLLIIIIIIMIIKNYSLL